MRTATVAVMAAAFGAAFARPAPARDFHCPAAGTIVTTSTGTSMAWQEAESGHPHICRAAYGPGRPGYWAFALVPSDNLVTAMQDEANLAHYMPLTPDKAFTFDVTRLYEGAMRRFVGSVVVLPAERELAGVRRPVSVVHISAVGGAPLSDDGRVTTASVRLIVDRSTNALLGIDIDPTGPLSGLPTVHWSALSITAP